MIQSISHIGLAVSDPDKTARLFSEILSAEIFRHDSTGKKTPEVYAFVAGTWFVFVATTPHSERSDDHIAFRVPDETLEDYAQKLTQLGLTYEFSRHGPDARSLYFFDYDNHLIELHTGALEDWLSMQRIEDTPQ